VPGGTERRKKMAQMSQQQIDDFLEQPLIARVATVRPDGRPHVVPVWFEWDGSTLRFEAEMGSAKVTNLRHDARVSVAVDVTRGGFRYRAVLMEGRGRIVEDRTVAVPVIERIFRRYVGDEGLETSRARRIVHESNSGVVEVMPERVISWDHMGEEGAPG
jgi:PPOX class probable F420-dependent enzyme